MAQINIELATIDCGQLVKNKISIEIPLDAAEIIYNAWHSEKMPQHEAIVAHNLTDNQVANCELVIAGQVMGGMLNMVSVDTDDRLLSIVDPDKNEEE